jgi:TolB-like protein/Tfp pilus assembly protein PilF
LQKAMKILQQEEITVSEVAYKVGFGSPAYFTKCFHEYFGYPPGEAKNRNNEDLSENNDNSANKPVDETEIPLQKKPFRKIILYSAGIVLALFIIYLFFNNFSFESFSILPGNHLKAEDKSIAVLPFKSLSSDEENQYFAEGVTRNILYNLIQISEIKVINSPVEELDGSPLDLKKMAGKLNVRFFLSGSVQKSGEQVLVMAQLTDITNNQIIWSDRYDKKLTDIFQVQSQIATQVASRLQTIIPKNEKERIEKVPTTSQEAYNWYLMGRYLLDRRPNRDENIKRYIEPFEKAITADPNYAEAYAGLADVYLAITRSQCYPRPEGFIKANENIFQALKLDPSLAEAHATLGESLIYEWKWEEARKELELALDLNPNNATTQTYYSYLMFTLRNYEAYRIHIFKAIELNPLSPRLINSKAYIFWREGSFDKALEEFNKILELYPVQYSVYWSLWHFYRKTGEEQKAVEVLQKAFLFDPADSAFMISIPSIYKNKGIKGLKKSLYEYNIKSDLKGSWRGLARYCIETGDKEKALDWLEKAYEWKIPSLPDINGDPDFDPIRNEPRFQALLDSMGLTSYQ